MTMETVFGNQIEMREAVRLDPMMPSASTLLCVHIHVLSGGGPDHTPRHASPSATLSQSRGRILPGCAQPRKPVPQRNQEPRQTSIETADCYLDTYRSEVKHESTELNPKCTCRTGRAHKSRAQSLWSNCEAPVPVTFSALASEERITQGEVRTTGEAMP